jgi:hypothetical protein
MSTQFYLNDTKSPFQTVLGCEGRTLAACTRLSRRRADCFGRCTKSNLLDFPESSKSSSLRFLRNQCVFCIPAVSYNQSHRRWNCCCCVLPRPISRFEVHYLPAPLCLPSGHHHRLCSSVLVHLTAVLATPQYCDVLLGGGEDSYCLHHESPIYVLPNIKWKPLKMVTIN